jgi:hypothetical protein
LKNIFQPDFVDNGLLKQSSMSFFATKSFAAPRTSASGMFREEASFGTPYVYHVDLLKQGSRGNNARDALIPAVYDSPDLLNPVMCSHYERR